jgi:deoxyribonucleoside regulator
MPGAIGQAEIIAQVAHLYFEKEYDQGAIADRLKVSRSSVSRLLAQARRQGIVEIRIHYPAPLAPELAQGLCERFRLKEARVLKTTGLSSHAAPIRVSQLAAKYLEENLQDGDILAMSWGTTLYQVVQNLQPARRINAQVVQMVGAIGASNSDIDGANLVRQLAQTLGGEYFSLSAPLIVENVETQRALLQEPSISKVLDLARQASIALVGIGAVARGASSPVRANLLTSAELKTIQKHEGIGDVCSQYFDVWGNLVAKEINQRVVALDLESLRALPRVVGVASGTHKAKAILGALRGGFISALITDDLTANRVLQLGS